MGGPKVSLDGGDGDLFEFAHQRPQAPVGVGPCAVLVYLFGAEDLAHRLGFNLAGPEPIRPVQVRGVGVAVATGAATAHGAGQYRPRQSGAEGDDLGQDTPGPVGGISAERHGYTFAPGEHPPLGGYPSV